MLDNSKLMGLKGILLVLLGILMHNYQSNCIKGSLIARGPQKGSPDCSVSPKRASHTTVRGLQEVTLIYVQATQGKTAPAADQ